MVWRLITTVSLLALSLAGCVPPERTRNLTARLQKVESERDAAQHALHTERSEKTALSRKAAEAERRAAAAEAELNALRSRVETLQRENDELVALIKERAAAPLARPPVPATALPAGLDGALRRFAEKFARRVWYDPARGAVSFANDRLFESGSDTVRPDAQAALHELAGIAVEALPEGYELVVVGHTDDTPITKPETRARHPTNWHLSVHRAIAVKDVLVSAGVPARRIGVMGYGPYRPVSDDRARNRRVEVFFVPEGGVQPFAPVRPPG